MKKAEWWEALRAYERALDDRASEEEIEAALTRFLEADAAS